MQRVITNFTVLEEDYRGRQMGWRNYLNSSSEQLVELRYGGSADVLNMPLDDFKKFIITGEQLVELMAKQEKADAKATQN